MCKPFPPPLVRGGVFLVGLESKYRDIADGNPAAEPVALPHPNRLESKYRDIADGNLCRNSSQCGREHLSDTKYRVIADGNSQQGRS